MSVGRPGNSRGGAPGGTRRRALGAIGAGAVLGVAARPAGPWPAGAVWAAPLPLSGRAQAPAQAARPGAAAQAVVYFPETGHHLQAGFLEHWRRHQGPARLGPPVSEEQWDAGVGGMVQQFQLARLEWRGEASRPAAAPPGAVREVMEGAGAGVAGGGGRVPRAPGVPDWTSGPRPARAAPDGHGRPDPPGAGHRRRRGVGRPGGAADGEREPGPAGGAGRPLQRYPAAPLPRR